MKNLVRRIIKSLRKKELIAIQYPVDSNKILDGKVALITGAAGGIGSAIVKELCSSGCKVIISGTNKSKLENLRQNLSVDGLVGGVFCATINYEDIDSFEKALDQIEETTGSIDILVCSAGVHTENVNFWTMTPAEYDRVMDINLKGTFFMCQAVAKRMIFHKNRGKILLISSSRGSEPAWSPYGLSKWGMNGLTQGLAKILAPYGINVNSIAPGSTATSLIGVKEGDSICCEDNSFGRLCTPEEVGALARYLVNDSSTMINGETIHMSAGRGVWDIR